MVLVVILSVIYSDSVAVSNSCLRMFVFNSKASTQSRPSSYRLSKPTSLPALRDLTIFVTVRFRKAYRVL